MTEGTITRSWFEGSQILPEHEGTEIRQVSAWLHKDSQILVISKDESKWTIPGGHPEVGETTEESLKREVWEESGVEIDGLEHKLLGYYLIDDNSGAKNEKYLQLRFLVDLNGVDISNAKPSEDHEINFSKLVPVSEVPNYVKWAGDSKDYLLVRYLVEV